MSNPNLRVPYGQLTFDAEGLDIESSPLFSRKPHWPRGASGITIGRGYDTGYKSAYEVEAHLKSAGANQRLITELKKAAGLRGSHAQAHWNANKTVLKSLILSHEAQKKLFEIIYPIYEADVIRWMYREKSIGPDIFNGVVNWSRLDSRIKVVLVDFRYRGDFFGREKTYSGEKLQTLRKLHAIIQKNSHGKDNYNEFCNIVCNSNSFPEIPGDRFHRRKQFLQTQSNDQTLALSLDGSFTFDAEERPNLDRPYVPEAYEEPGIIIGRGFNLRTRHCYKARPLRFRSHSYREEIDTIRNEIVRPEKELKLLLEAAGIPTTKLLNARKEKGEAARTYLQEHPDLPSLTPEQQRNLFDLVYPLYESDALLLCNNPKIMAKFRVGCVNWSRLSSQIKTVLVDLCFTGDFNFISRKFLLKHISNNDVQSFGRALLDWNNWDKKKAPWKTNTSLVATPPKKNVWTKRSAKFKALLKNLDPTPIRHQSQPLNLPLIRTTENGRSLPLLEPGISGSVDPNTNSFFEIPQFIPDLLRIEFLDNLIPSTQPEKTLTSNSMEEDASTLPPIDDDLQDAAEGSDLYEGVNFLYDIFFPLPNSSYQLEVPSDRPANFIRLLNSANHIVKKGQRIRFKYQNQVEYTYLKILDVEGDLLELEKEVRGELLENIAATFDIPFLLPLNKIGIGDLLGDTLPAIKSIISSARDIVDDLQKHVIITENSIEIPLTLTLDIPRKKKTRTTLEQVEEQTEHQHLNFYWKVKFVKREEEWILSPDSTKMYLRFPESSTEQLFDFGIFTLAIPPRPHVDGQIASAKESDAYFDLAKREFGFTLGTLEEKQNETVDLYFPGGLPDETDLQKGKDKRFLLQLEPLDDQNFFRLNPQGMSVKAKVTSKEVFVDEGRVPIKLNPSKSSSTGIVSRIHIVDNTIVEASIFAKMKLPGFQKLQANVSASLKQEVAGEIPSVSASIELENNDQSSLAALDLKYLQMKLDSVYLEISWSSVNRKWDFKASADGQISLSNLANLIPDLKDFLKVGAIKVQELDLKSLNLPKINLGLNLAEPSRFEILDGLFGCQFDDLGFDWSFKGGATALKSAQCSFRFNQPTVMDVEVDVGGLHVELKKEKFGIKIPSSIGIRMKLGEAVKFSGEFGWIEKPHSRYFFASGSVELEGFPEIKALLKLGSVTKLNGEKALSVVLYAETDIEMELFPGVVLKSIGGGVGINNRLKAIDATPNESEIIEKIDTIHPHRESAWKDVRENGLYLSIVASATLASNRGGDKAFNAYVMRLIMSLDTNLDIIAAGKLWLASSVGFVKNRSNIDRPALVGALVLSPRQHRLGVELRSRKNPAIESNPLLKRILDKLTTHLAFRITPDLVDYHLKEMTYKEKFYGVNVEVSGHYRIAAFRRAILAKAGLRVAGHFSKTFQAGPGGFSCRGHLLYQVEYGGLLTSKGINLYGMIKVSLGFQASAFIKIGFSISVKVFGKRFTKSWSVTFRISLPSIQLGFYGAIAISNGNLGFEGKISISISICGYRLSISPRLSYNPGLVNKVRKKIKAFEKLLDNLGDPSPLSNEKSLLYNDQFSSIEVKKFDSESTTKPQWFHYEGNKQINEAQTLYRHSFLPSPKSAWITPRCDQRAPSFDEVFVDGVTKIAVGQLEGATNFTHIDVSNEGYLKVWLSSFDPSKWPIDGVVVLLAHEKENIWFIRGVDPSQHAVILSIEPDASIEGLVFNQQTSSTGTLHRPKTVLFSPWIEKNRTYFLPNDKKQHRDSFEISEDEISAVRNIVAESTLSLEITDEPSKTTFELIYDPRVESTSREFLTQEAQELPEDVLSAYFKPFTETANTSSTNRDDLAMISKYETTLDKIGQEQKHHIHDLDPFEEHLQAKGQVVQILMNDLNEASLVEERVFDKGKVRANHETLEVYGLIFNSENPLETDKLYIQRQQNFETASVIKPDANIATLRQKLHLPKVRQDFINSTGKGKIAISLPIKIDPQFLGEKKLENQENQEKLENLCYFRIYRSMGDEGERQLVADRVQPKIWKYRQRTPGPSGELNFDGTNLLSLPIELTKEHSNSFWEVSLSDNQSNHVFYFDNSSRALKGSISSLKMGVYQYSMTLVSTISQYLIEPYIFRDEIEVSRDVEKGTYVDYFLEVLPTAQRTIDTPQRTIDTSEMLIWNREYLYVPDQKPLPEKMSIAFRVETLKESSSAEIPFVIYEGEEFENFSKSPSDFELWVKELPLQPTGFYAGNQEFSTPSSQTRKPALEKLDVEKQFETSDGKHPLRVITTTFGYAISNRDFFKMDCSYQFYIGFNKNSNQKLLPMDHYLARAFLGSKKPPKLRHVEQIEWISHDVFSAVQQRQARWQDHEQFFAKELYIHQKSFLYTQFNQEDVNTGGMEIVIVDHDEPGIISRQMCEVLGQTPFEESKVSIKDSSKWQLPEWELKAIEKNFSNRSIYTDTSSPIDIPATYFANKSALITNLINQINLVIDLLEHSSFSWKTTYEQSIQLFARIALFLRSSLNIDEPTITAAIDAVQTHLTSLLLGCKLEKNPDLLIEEISKLEETIGEEENSATSSEFNEEQDRFFARRLLSIVYRRISIAEDLFSAIEGNTLPVMRGSDPALTNDNKLAGMGKWLQICREYPKVVAGDHPRSERGPHCTWLIATFFDDQTKIEDNFEELIDKLKITLIGFKNLFASSSSYLQALCKIVPIAKDLSLHIEDLSKSGIIVKNMHHSVNIDASLTPHVPATLTSFSPFLPDTLKLGEVAVSNENISLSNSKFIVPFFNLMEYLGFAVDLKIKNEMEQSLSQKSLIDAISKPYENKEPHKNKNSHLFVLKGIAANSVENSADNDTYSFVKLAHIPKALFRKRALAADISVEDSQTLTTPGTLSLPTQEGCVFQILDVDGSYSFFFAVSIETITENDIQTHHFTLDRPIPSTVQIQSIALMLYSLPNLPALLENRGIEISADSLNQYLPYFQYVAFMLDRHASQHAKSRVYEIHMEESSKRWITLPAKGGISKSIWQVPDRFGHRYQVALRKVSRYEPLINWTLARFEPYPLEKFQAHIAKAYLVRIKPTHYANRVDNTEQMIRTYNYPHPTKAFFSYQIPLAAAKSVKNQLASVRTGYKGHDLVFKHELIDREEASIMSILNNMLPTDDSIEYESSGVDPAPIHENVSDPFVRLFDHERFLTLPMLPYYQRYFIDVRTLYDSYEQPVANNRPLLPTSTTVEPSQLRLYSPKVTQTIEGEYFIYHFNLPLTRHVDNLTADQDEHMPYPVAVESTPPSSGTIAFKGQDIPDLASVYNLYWKVEKKEGLEYYIPITTVHMPWSDGHGSNELTFPYLKDTNSKFTIHNVGPTTEMLEDTLESKVPIEFKRDGENFRYRVQFKLKIALSDSRDLGLYHDVSKFKCQLSRKQQLSLSMLIRGES